VDLLACCRLDDVLPELAHQDRAAAKLGVLLDEGEDIPLLGGRAEPEEQVGRGEVEEMQHMALHDLSVMHQAAHLLRRGRDRVGADDHVHRLGSGEVVAHRADAAKTLHDHRNFPQEPAPDEPFEPAKLNDMQPCFVHRAVGIEVDRHLAMAFDARDGRDLDQFRLGHPTP
jgi:hypothetical protein